MLSTNIIEHAMKLIAVCESAKLQDNVANVVLFSTSVYLFGKSLKFMCDKRKTCMDQLIVHDNFEETMVKTYIGYSFYLMMRSASALIESK